MRKFIKDNILIILAILYLLWPIDIIPELFTFWSGPIPFLDDIGLLGTAIILRIYSILKTRNAIQEDVEKVSDS